jgi:hypothetical protein
LDTASIARLVPLNQSALFSEMVREKIENGPDPGDAPEVGMSKQPQGNRHVWEWRNNAPKLRIGVSQVTG